MRHIRRGSSDRAGFTLVEVGVATFIVVLTALAGFAYYSTARVAEINEWRDQNALFLCEREIEAWHANGFTGLTGFPTTDCTVVGTPTAEPGALTYLPYGYRFGAADGAWTASRKDVVLDGFTYRIRAANIYTTQTGGNNCFVERNVGGVIYSYRRLRVVVQWGNLTATSSTWQMSQETRMAR